MVWDTSSSSLYDGIHHSALFESLPFLVFELNENIYQQQQKKQGYDFLYKVWRYIKRCTVSVSIMKWDKDIK